MDWFAVNRGELYDLFAECRQNAQYDLVMRSYWTVLSFFWHVHFAQVPWMPAPEEAAFGVKAAVCR